MSGNIATGEAPCKSMPPGVVGRKGTERTTESSEERGHPLHHAQGDKSDWGWIEINRKKNSKMGGKKGETFKRKHNRGGWVKLSD